MMKNNKQKRYLLIISGLLTIIAIVYFCQVKYFKRTSSLNVLLITIDALRPDHLSCYGYERNTSPNIDRLAKGGVLFTQAISQATITPVSLSSIFTSLYPYTHGVIDWENSLNPSIPTLAQILKNNGYYTKAVITNDALEIIKAAGINQGFKEFTTDGKTADKLTEEAIEFLKESKKRPFFLYLHYYDVHCPYRPPDPYNKMFLNDELYTEKDEHLPILNCPFYGYKAIPRVVAEKNITSINYYISQYDGAIGFTDKEIARLLNKLKELGLDKKTLIIITADHGESLGEHDYYFTHGSLFDTDLKVPLIITCVNIIPQGKIINFQVSLIDIMPTILEILRIKKPKIIEGISLLPLILGKEKYPRIFTFSGYKGIASVRTEEWKLIRYEPKEFSESVKKIDFYAAKSIEKRFMIGENENPVLYALYNLKSDPKELYNLTVKEKEKFIFLKEKLDNWIEQSQSIASPQKIPFSEELKEKLRSLGYLQ